MDLNTRILVVDDDPLQRELLSELFPSATLQEAADGPQALDAARWFTPHLILLDVEMPGLSGLDVCRQVRDLAAHPRPAVIIVSGRSSPDDQRAALDAGADDFVAKPWREEDLTRRASLLLARPDGPGAGSGRAS